jgi:hypothetical protein
VERRRELLDASPQLQDLPWELWLNEVDSIQTDHHRRRHVAGALEEIPKPVVVVLLQASRGRHGNDHRPFPRAAQLLEDDGELESAL